MSVFTGPVQSRGDFLRPQEISNSEEPVSGRIEKIEFSWVSKQQFSTIVYRHFIHKFSVKI